MFKAMSRLLIAVVSVLLLIIFLSVPGMTQENDELKISGGSTTKVGTSFHDWYCEATPVLTFKNNGSATPIEGFPNGIPDLSMSVSVADLNCDGDNKSKVSKLEKNLQVALKAKSNPNIVFRMTKYVLNSDNTVAVTGNLTIAGVTKEVSFGVKLTERINGTNLLAKGETIVRMSDYDIQPITTLLGTIVTKDEVKIEFSVELNPARLIK